MKTTTTGLRIVMAKDGKEYPVLETIEVAEETAHVIEFRVTAEEIPYAICIGEDGKYLVVSNIEQEMVKVH